jgi:hypothetical protein
MIKEVVPDVASSVCLAQTTHTKCYGKVHPTNGNCYILTRVKGGYSWSRVKVHTDNLGDVGISSMCDQLSRAVQSSCTVVEADTYEELCAQFGA